MPGNASEPSGSRRGEGRRSWLSQAFDPEQSISGVRRVMGEERPCHCGLTRGGIGALLVTTYVFQDPPDEARVPGLKPESLVPR